VAALAKRAYRVPTQALEIHPAQRVALQQQLLDALLEALKSMEPHQRAIRGRPRRNRLELLRHAIHMVDQGIDQPITVEDFCTRIGVSETTLHEAFQEQLGLSPHRYLMLRRLQLIHSALRNEMPKATIATICARYGVWDFGRFASAYQGVFGALPSRAFKHDRDVWPGSLNTCVSAPDQRRT
jgi:AraC family ethanolamine operon transcriptional activator